MPIIRSLLLLMIGLTLGFGLGNILTKTSGKISFTKNPKKEKLSRLIDYIEEDYVNPVNIDSIVDETVLGILNKLDPHSSYIPSKNAQEMAERMQGDFIGIGINYYIRNDSIAVISTIPNGPSAKAGILAGDRILMVNKDTLFGKKLTIKNTLVNKLKGAKGSIAKLSIYRPQQGKLSIEVVRGVVPIKSVEASFMFTQEIGYIKIKRFAETTFNEFKNALNSLKKEATLKKLIIDLRANGGGYVEPALKIADEFLENGKLIMFTKNKENILEKSFATAKGDFENGTVYVLIDENTASASEILAGALQDNDKGVIIGRRSFGKGLVQQEMELGDGSKVRLTVSNYFTPTGRSIQRPYNKGTEAYYEEYLERYNNGELNDSTKIKKNKTLPFKTPKGKTVYGGGGIIPDIYIQKSTDRNIEVLEYANYSGILSHFIFNELDEKRQFYNKLTVPEIQELNISDLLLQKFERYSQQNGLEFSGNSAAKITKLFLKAEIGNQLISPNLYNQIISANDKMFQKITELNQK